MSPNIYLLPAGSLAPPPAKDEPKQQPIPVDMNPLGTNELVLRQLILDNTPFLDVPENRHLHICITSKSYTHYTKSNNPMKRFSYRARLATLITDRGHLVKSKTKQEEKPYLTYCISGSPANTIVEALGHLLNETTKIVQEKVETDLAGAIC